MNNFPARRTQWRYFLKRVDIMAGLSFKGEHEGGTVLKG